MKKKLLFTAYTLDIGGMETALLNLLNNIDYNRYEVTLILEKKEGIFLEEVNENVIVKEVKVSKCKLGIIRKIINFTRKFKFRLFNKNKFDFSCCYATYSYSGNKLALIGSKNSMLYVHNNYKDVYRNDEKKIREFFDTRNINSFKYITFVSNESKKDFLKFYPDLKDKTVVFNNFVDTDKINNLSEEIIEEEKPKDSKLLVFVGRLDEDAKKLTRAISLVKELDNTTLWLIGDGPDRNMYEELVKEEKLTSRVKFMGKKKNPYPYISKADYIILTSDYEGFPVTYLEALTLNKEIITTIPVSDDKIDIKKYAHIISKEHKEMVKEVKEIFKKENKVKEISIDSVQRERIIELEKIFNEKC